MVAVPIPARRHRPVRDPVRPPSWLTSVALVAAGFVLSLLGWVTGARVDAITESATRNGQAAAVEQWQAAEAEALAARTADQRDALAALVVYRCDTGQITDGQLCEAARRLWR